MIWNVRLLNICFFISQSTELKYFISFRHQATSWIVHTPSSLANMTAPFLHIIWNQPISISSPKSIANSLRITSFCRISNCVTALGKAATYCWLYTTHEYILNVKSWIRKVSILYLVSFRTILAISAIGNKYIQDNQPWKLLKGSLAEQQRAATVIVIAANLGALLALLLGPYMPDTSSIVLNQVVRLYGKTRSYARLLFSSETDL